MNIYWITRADSVRSLLEAFAHITGWGFLISLGCRAMAWVAEADGPLTAPRVPTTEQNPPKGLRHRLPRYHDPPRLRAHHEGAGSYNGPADAVRGGDPVNAGTSQAYPEGIKR